MEHRAAPGPAARGNVPCLGNAAQFRLIVDVVADEQGQSLTGVSREQLPGLLSARLPVALYADLEPVLDARLRQLVLWGTFESWQDEARSDEDFLRNRERFQLTERGAAVNRLARAVEGQGQVASSTAVLAPPILATQAALALEALTAQRYADAAATIALVQTTLADMAQTASVWQSRLAATIGGVPDEDKVRRLRQTVTDYVDMWGAGVDVHSASISDSARRLLDSDPETWRRLAVHRLPDDASEATVTAVADEVRDAIRVLDTWFSGPHSQARRLRRQIRDAVVPLVRSHRTLLAMGGRSRAAPSCSISSPASTRPRRTPTPGASGALRRDSSVPATWACRPRRSRAQPTRRSGPPLLPRSSGGSGRPDREH